MPSAVLAAAMAAAPVHADPGAPPGGGGRSDDAPGQSADRRPATPDRAPDRDAAGPPASVPARPPQAKQPPQAATPQPGPPAEVPPRSGDAVPPAHANPGGGSVQDGAPKPDGPKADPAEGAPSVPAAAAKGQKVVVCKYVRKPGENEIPSHIIVVNENALLGKGFAGTFPFPFSDAQVNSVAIRYAEKGERANQISTAICPADQPPGEEPPGEEPPGEEPPGEELPGEESSGVGGIVEERGGPTADAVLQRASGDVLPSTGAPAHLGLVALAGGLCTVGGIWLVTRRRRAVSPLG